MREKTDFLAARVYDIVIIVTDALRFRHARVHMWRVTVHRHELLFSVIY